MRGRAVVARVALRVEAPLSVERASRLERLEDFQVGLLLEHDACRLGDEGDRVVLGLLAATAHLVLEDGDAHQHLVLDLGVERADDPLVLIGDLGVRLGMRAHLVELVVGRRHLEEAREGDVREAGVDDLLHLYLDSFTCREGDAALIHVRHEGDDEAAAAAAVLLCLLHP